MKLQGKGRKGDLKTRFAAVWTALSLVMPPVAAQPLAEASMRPALALRGLPHLPLLPASLFKTMRHAPTLPHETAAYQRTFRILLAHPERTDRFDEAILFHARRHGLDPRLLKAIIAAESQFDTGARSPRGARGLMQLMPATAEEMGVSRGQLADPERNIAAGAAYVARLYDAAWRKFKLQGVRYPDAPLWLVRRVIASYNAGPKALGKRAWHPQTIEYVHKVLLFYRSPVTDVRRSTGAGSSELEVKVIRFNTGSPY